MAITALTPALLIAPQQLTNATATYYTGPAGGNGTVVKKMVLFNTDTVAHNVTINLVPNGGTAAVSNEVLVVSVAAGSTYIVNEFNNQVVGPNATIQAKADAASVVNIAASGFTF